MAAVSLLLCSVHFLDPQIPPPPPDLAQNPIYKIYDPRYIYYIPIFPTVGAVRPRSGLEARRARSARIKSGMDPKREHMVPDDDFYT